MDDLLFRRIVLIFILAADLVLSTVVLVPCLPGLFLRLFFLNIPLLLLLIIGDCR